MSVVMCGILKRNKRGAVAGFHGEAQNQIIVFAILPAYRRQIERFAPIGFAVEN